MGLILALVAEVDRCPDEQLDEPPRPLPARADHALSHTHAQLGQQSVGHQQPTPTSIIIMGLEPVSASEDVIWDTSNDRR